MSRFKIPHRKVTGIVTLALIAAMLITGTLAWFNSQAYTNRFEAENNIDWDVQLIDDFELDNDRLLQGWEEGQTVDKTVFVTYIRNGNAHWNNADGTHNQHIESPSWDDPNVTMVPVWVRVNFHEFYVLRDSNDAVISQQSPRPGSLFTGTEFNRVSWTMNDTQIMSVADWVAGGSVQGDFWIFDNDGWFYYAQPLAPGSRAPDIMRAVTLDTLNDGESLEYEIHVNMEAIDRGLRGFSDWTDTGVSFIIQTELLGQDVFVCSNDIAWRILYTDASGNSLIITQYTFGLPNSATGAIPWSPLNHGPRRAALNEWFTDNVTPELATIARLPVGLAAAGATDDNGITTAGAAPSVANRPNALFILSEEDVVEYFANQADRIPLGVTPNFAGTSSAALSWGLRNVTTTGTGHRAVTNSGTFGNHPGWAWYWVTRPAMWVNPS